MPKTSALEAHFDANALLDAVHAQDHGLHVSTNNPKRFREILYAAARKFGKRVFIYGDPRSANRLTLLKTEVKTDAA